MARKTISVEKRETQLSIEQEPPFDNPGARVTGVGDGGSERL